MISSRRLGPLLLVATLAASRAAAECEHIVNVESQQFVPAHQARLQDGVFIPQRITVVANGVTFDSNYDNGSLGAVASRRGAKSTT